MNEKENFVFLASWAEAIEAYDKAGQPELGGELAKQIVYYGTSGQMTTDNPLIEGFVKAMWCGNQECEDKIKEDTTATSRCMPFAQENLADTTKLTLEALGI